MFAVCFRPLALLVCVASVFFLLPHRSAAQAAAPRPHIIFILADDLGYADLGCYGGKIAPTPHLDRMARGGTRFTNYYSAAPICSPARAALITGMSPGRCRITSFLQTRAGNRGCEQADFLDPALPALPRALKQAGYATAHFGKWHLGGGRDVANPPGFAKYGYDEHAGTWESPEPDPEITATNWIWSEKDKVKRWERTSFFVDKTLDFIERHKANPCFVNLWLDDVHTPWVPAENSSRVDNRQNFERVLAETDRQIGRLLDGVERAGLSEKTLIIFTSDNGPLPTFNGGRAGIFRGSKLSLYEGGIRVPFIARWPGRIPADRVDDQTILSALDLFPTFGALAGATSPDKANLPEGQEMSAALFGKVSARSKPLFWEYGRNDTFFKFPGRARDRSPNIAIRDGEWKLLMRADGTGRELYQIRVDPGEAQNLSEAQPEIAQSLSERTLAWRKSLP